MLFGSCNYTIQGRASRQSGRVRDETRAQDRRDRVGLRRIASGSVVRSVRCSGRGIDIDAARVAELKDGNDRTREVEAEDLGHSSLVFTADPAALKQSDFYIVTMPTPIDEAGGRISAR
jgi:hypothetical protein